MPEDQVTISIFRAVKNPELWKEMEKAGELVKTGTEGIYHVVGMTKLPFQIVITSELKGREYAACRVLTDKANETDVECVIEDGEKETDDKVREYYRTFLDLVAEKNLGNYSAGLRIYCAGRAKTVNSTMQRVNYAS